MTRDYVLGLKAVLPTGELIRTGHRSWKGVAGYDLTQLLVGSEGTLAVIVEATLKLIPLPRAVATLLAFFPDEDKAALAVQKIFGAGLLPRACELLDGETMRAVSPRRAVQVPGRGRRRADRRARRARRRAPCWSWRDPASSAARPERRKWSRRRTKRSGGGSGRRAG